MTGASSAAAAADVAYALGGVDEGSAAAAPQPDVLGQAWLSAGSYPWTCYW